MKPIEIETEIAWFKSAERAENALVDMFAAGDVCPGERPRVRRSGKLFTITTTERLQFVNGDLVHA
jgi:hypothetical protein